MTRHLLPLLFVAAACAPKPDPATSAGAAAATASAAAARASAAAAPVVDSLGAARDLLFWKRAVQTRSYRNMNLIYATRPIRKGATVYPLPRAEAPFPAVTYQWEGRTLPMDSFLVRNHVAGFLVIQDGKIRDERYLQGNDERSRWMSFSVGKSVVSTLVGAALADGSIRSLDDAVTAYLPGLKGSAYDGVTVRHLLTMSSGVRYNEAYLNRDADINTVVACVASRTAGCIEKAAAGWPRETPAGTRFNYNTAETHLLGLVVQAATKKPLADYFSEKIWVPFGMEADGFWLLESDNGQEFGGGGCNMTLRDWGRFGLFILNGGMAGGKPVLPAAWLRDATRPTTPATQYGKLMPGFAGGYGYLWWLQPPVGARTAAPNVDGAFAAEGVFGQEIHIDPKRKLVVVTWRTWPEPGTPALEAEGAAFMSALAGALTH